ncbi:M23 family metallopeptidase [Cellulosimicrobium protaetiae]|uniref:M23 family metallopeptidase n=1 Tax=Cellulosimicrobium protaetiae TaxID=2587808 RepID=A0A6M5UHV0_9MICO|nr:M23 family metallopeptidase [Cellulosimicrobium protaetiae]QJW37112.1 M23 family metallopeptidase [Cellulosimicrobium protaetiae]
MAPDHLSLTVTSTAPSPSPAAPRRRTLGIVLSVLVLSAGPVADAAPGAVVTPHALAEASATAAWVPPLDLAPDDLEVLAPFDPPEQDWLPGHRGVDLAATPGAPVRSPAPGVVTFAGPVAGRGVVVVTHDDGLRTSLEPVTGVVPRGSRVAAGAVVGTLQASQDALGSHCPGTCVHWGVRRGDRYVDPLALLGDRPPIVLLPLGEP